MNSYQRVCKQTRMLRRDQESMHKAIIDGDQILLTSLLRARVDVDIREPRLGWTPLHIAVRDDRLDLAEFLLENKAGVNKCTNDKLTALHMAVANRNVDMVKLLLRYRINVNPEDNFEGKTPLYMAVEYDCPEITRLLLDNGALLSNAILYNRSILHFAIEYCSEELVKVLLGLIDDPDLIDAKEPLTGKTPLYLAVEHKYYTVVDILLEKGSDVRLPCGNFNAVDLAVMQGDLLMLDVLLRGKCPKRAYCKQGSRILPINASFCCLHYAMQARLRGISRSLIRSGFVSVEDRDPEGFTPLQFAAKLGHIEMAKICLKHRANVNARNSVDGSSALVYAVQNLDQRMIKLLLEYDASVNETYLRGNVSSTVIDMAVAEECIWLVNLLLEHGAIVRVDGPNAGNNMMAIKCTAQMMSIGKCKNDRNVEIIMADKLLAKAYDDCIKEIELMKVTKAIDDITFHDLFTKDVLSLALYARNERFPKALRFSRVIRKFPIYAISLYINFIKGCARNLMTDASKQSVEEAIGSMFPDLSANDVLLFMTNDDCKHTLSAAYDNDFYRSLPAIFNDWRRFLD